MPVYKRAASPYWWMSITIPGRPRFRGSTGETDERKARIVEAETYRKLLAGKTPNDGWRIRDCFGAYWDEHAKHSAVSSQIFTHLELLSEGLGRDTLIQSLTNAMILDYRARRRGGGIMRGDRKSRPVAANSVNRDLSYLAAALNWAAVMHQQAVPPLAWKKLRVREPEHRIRFAGGDEFARLLAAAHADLHPIIVAAVTTGLRKSNLLTLQWHQLDLKRRTITIPRSKGRKPIVARIVPALSTQLAATPVAKRLGKVFDTTNFRRRWYAALKDAKIEDFKFHDLRHTFGSWARQHGADLADICEAMAHSSVSVTMRYAHVKPDSDLTAFDRVGQLLAAPPRGTKKRA